LACGDQRRLTGNGSALEVVLHDYALYKSTFTLLYFTYEQMQNCEKQTPLSLRFSDIAGSISAALWQGACKN